MAHVEIERKFLLEALPDRKVLGDGELIIQSFQHGLRIRERAGKYYIVVKGPGSLVRSEWESKIPAFVFRKLWKENQGNIVVKTRYKIKDRHYILELDEYHGHLRGLVTLECEFTGENQEEVVQEALAYEPPAWLRVVRDVTEDSRYTNNKLSQYGIPI